MINQIFLKGKTNKVFKNIFLTILKYIDENLKNIIKMKISKCVKLFNCLFH